MLRIQHLARRAHSLLAQVMPDAFEKALVRHPARRCAQLFVDRRNLLTQQEYMVLTGKEEPAAFVTDGHFKGYASNFLYP